VPSGRLKNDFGEVDETMIEGVERPYDNIFCFQSFETSDTDEVAKVMF
jgi:hypothetical protein